MENEIIVALIRAGASLSSALIGACAVLFAAKRVIDRKKLRLSLIQALNDVHFLMEVEKVHVEMSVIANDKSNKVKVRDIVRGEKGLEFSGKNTPSSIKRKLTKLSSLDD